MLEQWGVHKLHGIKRNRRWLACQCLLKEWSRLTRIPMNSVKKLAAAILNHALVDARKGCPEAREWLLKDDSSFPFWCRAYGVDAAFGRAELGKAILARPARELRDERITQALIKNPGLSNREIGRRLECQYEVVRQVRKKILQVASTR